MANEESTEWTEPCVGPGAASAAPSSSSTQLHTAATTTNGASTYRNPKAVQTTGTTS